MTFRVRALFACLILLAASRPAPASPLPWSEIGAKDQVREQLWPENAALAASLTRSAQDIIDALSGGNTGPGGHPQAEFTSISFQPEGRVRLQFAGDSGAPYLIESSTNLVDWQLIGVASSITNGQFQFDD